jgi:hypothetical protein
LKPPATPSPDPVLKKAALWKTSENKAKKSGKFSALENVPSTTTFRHAITTKSPAIYHVVPPRIPATPPQKHQQNSPFSRFHHVRKKMAFFAKKSA